MLLISVYRTIATAVKVLRRMNYTSAKRVFSKQYTFACYRVSRSRVSTRRSPFTTRVKLHNSNFSIFKFRVLFNFVYQIIYEIKSLRNFTLRYILTTKFSRFMVQLNISLSARLYRLSKVQGCKFVTEKSNYNIELQLNEHTAHLM